MYVVLFWVCCCCCGFVCVHTYGDQRTTSVVLSQAPMAFCFLFFEAASLTGLELTSKLDRLVIEPSSDLPVPTCPV